MGSIDGSPLGNVSKWANYLYTIISKQALDKNQDDLETFLDCCRYCLEFYLEHKPPQQPEFKAVVAEFLVVWRGAAAVPEVPASVLVLVLVLVLMLVLVGVWILASRLVLLVAVVVAGG